MADDRNKDDIYLKSSRKSGKFFVTGSDIADGANKTTISSSVFTEMSKSFADGDHLIDPGMRRAQAPILYALQQLEDDISDIYNEVSASVFQASYFPHATIDSASFGFISSSITPHIDDKYDIGASGKEFKDLYIDGTANLDRADIGAIGTNLIPVIPAKKGQGQTIGTTKARWSAIYLASSIDVSGSTLTISSPSASAAGDDFNVVVSGSVVAGDTDSGSIGTIDAPFKDLYVQSSSIYLADMSTHNFGSGNKTWNQMSRSEKLQRATVFQKDDVDKLKRGELLNDSGIISASGDLFVSGTTKLVGETEILGQTRIDGLTDIRGGLKINQQAITDAELQALRGLSTGNGSIQTQLNSKHSVINSSNRLDASLIGGGNVSSIEFNQLNGIGTSTIATQLAAKQDTITFGISNTNVIKCGDGIADNDFLKIDGTTLEGRSASELKGDLSLVKGDVGLGNVDNTSDASKPVSTATQTALNKKLNLTGGTMVGLIQERFQTITSINKFTVDVRTTSILEILIKNSNFVIGTATPAFAGQELTIIALTSGVIRHSPKPQAGNFVFANGSHLAVSAGQAYKFVTDQNRFWRQIH